MDIKFGHRVKIGEVSVDSGTIMIVDPCYIKNDSYDYAEVVEPTIDELFSEAIDGLGVVTRTGFGDGSYPVYVEFYTDEFGWKRVRSISVEFIGDEDE